MPGRESFSLRSHVFRPYVLSFVLPGTWSDFHSPCLQKQALEGKGQSRRQGIKDPEPSPQSCFSWWQQPSCLIRWHLTPSLFSVSLQLSVSLRACLRSSALPAWSVVSCTWAAWQIVSALLRCEKSPPHLLWDVAGRHENYPLEAELILCPTSWVLLLQSAPCCPTAHGGFGELELRFTVRTLQCQTPVLCLSLLFSGPLVAEISVRREKSYWKALNTRMKHEISGWLWTPSSQEWMSKCHFFN